MPFRAQVLQRSVAEAIQGALLEEIQQACEAYAALTSPRQKARCIQGMMDVLERELSMEDRRAIMEACGRRCITAGILKAAQSLQGEARDLDDLLDRLNAAHIGGGHLRREGDAIHAAYDRCYCGSVSQTAQPLSTTYCFCSCGWYRQLFETLFEAPVQVDLLSSIVQGHDRCRFRISFSPASGVPVSGLRP